MLSRSDALALFAEKAVDPTELTTFLGLPVDPGICDALAQTAFPDDVLYGCRETHLLLPILSYTLEELRTVLPELHGPGFVMCQEERFFRTERLTPGWLLAPQLRGAPGDRAIGAAVDFIFPDEARTPRVVEAVWSAAVWSITRGELLFRNRYVLTSGVSVTGYRAKVGHVPYTLSRRNQLRFILDITLAQ